MDEVTPAAPAPAPAPGPAPAPQAAPSALDRLYPEALGTWRWTAAVVAVTVVVDQLVMWLAVYQRLSATARAAAILFWLVVNLAMFLPWSGLWAAASRVFRQDARFVSHLNIVMTVMLVWTAARLALGLAAFVFSVDAGMFYPRLLVLWAAWSWSLGGHLRQVSDARGTVLGAWGAGVAACIVGVVAAFQLFAFDKAPAMRYADVSVLPPFLRVLPASSIDAHLAGLDGLQAKVDARAKEKR